MKKRVLALLLALALIVSCAACGGNNNSSSSQGSGSSTTEGTSSDGEADAGDTAEDGEYPVLRFNLTYSTEPRSKSDEVIEALNEVLREKAGAEVEPVWINFADFKTQLNLMLVGGDDSLDFFSSFWYQPLSTLVSNGQVVAIDELIEEYGQDTLALFEGNEEILDCGRVDGKLYAIPTITAWATPNIYFAKKEDSDAANIDWSTLTDLDSLTPALLAMKEANPDHYYIPGSTEPYWIPKGIDYLGDTNYLGVLLDPANSTTVENYYESDYFLNVLENVKIWSENGIISPDPMSNNSATLQSIQNGLVSGTPGYDWSVENFVYQSNEQMTYGSELVGAEISPAYLTTGGPSTYLWHITPFCENPEAAMRVLNALYTDAEASTIYCYGVEGLTYQLNEDGSASYMPGEDSTTSGWSGGQNYVAPNSLLCPVWDNMMPDNAERIEESNANAIKSLALGFTCNLDPVADQVAACANVVAQYYTPLMNGVVDADEVLPEFQKALKDAGIDQIIQCKQEQLDAWLAAKGE